MEIIFCLFIAICIFMSFKSVVEACFQKNFFSFETILIFSYLYITLLIGFGMIYLICMQSNLTVLTESDVPVAGSYFEKLIMSMYFSAVTLFSVGYGDLVPIGIGRLLAVVEALIGYVLPAVFLARTFIGVEK